MTFISDLKGSYLRSDKSIPDHVLDLFQDTLDRPIAFHPVFVDLTGSVTAGLLLSQAVYWTKRVTSGDWFYKTMKQWEEETRLSRHEQESARKILRQFSFWQEERRGVPAKMYFRVDIAALYTELLGFKEGKYSQTRLPESGKLDCHKAANKKTGKRQTGIPQTGKHYKGISETTTEITSKTTTTALLPPLQPPSGELVSRGFVENILSRTLLKRADPGRVVQVAKQYERSQEEIKAIIHMLDRQYRESPRRIKDPTALLVSAIRDAFASTAITPSHQQEQDAVESEYRAAEEKFAALSEQEREEIFTKARARLHPTLRNSSQAVKAFAVGIVMSRARAPD